MRFWYGVFALRAAYHGMLIDVDVWHT